VQTVITVKASNQPCTESGCAFNIKASPTLLRETVLNPDYPDNARPGRSSATKL